MPKRLNFQYRHIDLAIGAVFVAGCAVGGFILLLLLRGNFFTESKGGF